MLPAPNQQIPPHLTATRPAPPHPTPPHTGVIIVGVFLDSVEALSFPLFLAVLALVSASTIVIFWSCAPSHSEYCASCPTPRAAHQDEVSLDESLHLKGDQGDGQHVALLGAASEGDLERQGEKEVALDIPPARACTQDFEDSYRAFMLFPSLNIHFMIFSGCCGGGQAGKRELSLLDLLCHGGDNLAHPLHDALVTPPVTAEYCFVMLSVTNQYYTYVALGINEAQVKELVNIFSIIFGIGGAAVSVISGLAQDKLGLTSFLGAQLVLVCMFAVTNAVSSFGAQLVAQVVQVFLLAGCKLIKRAKRMRLPSRASEEGRDGGGGSASLISFCPALPFSILQQRNKPNSQRHAHRCAPTGTGSADNSIAMRYVMVFVPPALFGTFTGVQFAIIGCLQLGILPGAADLAAMVFPDVSSPEFLLSQTTALAVLSVVAGGSILLRFACMRLPVPGSIRL